MHLICSYCGRYIKEEKPIENNELIHGTCLDCYVPTTTLTHGYSYDEYLETFDVPVVIMDSGRRILAANQSAQAMLDKPIDRLKGMLGGEALECPHAKLPGGCGRTSHCQTCTIRNLILRSIEQRMSYHNELVSLETENGRNAFLISTLFYDDLIQIVFEECRIGRCATTDVTEEPVTILEKSRTRFHTRT